jgi:hypothetical protein
MTKKPENNYPDWYKGPPDPHLSINNLGGGRWQCSDCGAIGGPDLLYSAGCTAPKEPCKHCGCSPVCARDCGGIAKALSDPDVYVAGFDQSKEH